MNRDYYDILGLSRTADEATIRKAYRKLAARYHPDRNPGDRKAEERFKEINEAHSVLIDPEKRKLYDRFGHNWKQYQHAGAGGFGDNESGFSGTYTESNIHFDDLFGNSFGSDIFERFFGQDFMGSRDPGRTAFRGNDYSTELTISLEEAYHGTSKMINIRGQKIRLNIKAGIEDGQTLRLSGKGAAGSSGAPAGDLLIKISITPHHLFRRDGKNLHCELPLDLYTAVLGGKASIKTMKGRIQLNIPAGTQNGKVFRLTGLGMPADASKTSYGDLFARVFVKIPEKLSAEELKLYKKLKKMKK